MDDFVSSAVCAERMKRNDERFGRDKDRLDKYEDTQMEILRITGTLSTVVERQEKVIANHDDRIVKIEQKSGKLAEKFIYALVAAVATAVVAFVVTTLGG